MIPIVRVTESVGSVHSFASFIFIDHATSQQSKGYSRRRRLGVTESEEKKILLNFGFDLWVLFCFLEIEEKKILKSGFDLRFLQWV